jgi:hypothetical protein
LQPDFSIKFVGSFHQWNIIRNRGDLQQIYKKELALSFENLMQWKLFLQEAHGQSVDLSFDEDFFQWENRVDSQSQLNAIVQKIIDDTELIEKDFFSKVDIAANGSTIDVPIAQGKTFQEIKKEAVKSSSCSINKSVSIN